MATSLLCKGILEFCRFLENSGGRFPRCKLCKAGFDAFFTRLIFQKRAPGNCPPSRAWNSETNPFPANQPPVI
jgi:hypothetical protein